MDHCCPLLRTQDCREAGIWSLWYSDSGCSTHGISWLVALQVVFGVSLVGWVESSAKTRTFSEISEP